MGLGITIMQPDITKLLSDLQDATQALEVAQKAAADAQRTETSCRNQVNELQKQVEAAIAGLRENAPRDTEWGSRRSRGERA